MTWRFDSKQPDPLIVGDGGQSFELRHKWLTGQQALAVHECFTAAIVSVESGAARGRGMTQFGLSGAVAILWRNIIGWSGVQDASGRDIPFERDENDDRGTAPLDEIMGRVPVKVSLRTVFVQMAMNGICLPDDVRTLFTAIIGDSGFDKELEECLPAFLPGRSEPDGGSSSTSATGETPTAGSG